MMREGNSDRPMLSLEMLRHGVHEREPAPCALRAGPLTLAFEPDRAWLRRVKWGDHEVLRGIYVAVRDQNWETVPPAVSNLSLEQGALSFTLSFDVICRQRDIDFRWRGMISGRDDGAIEFSMEGVAHSNFLRNRIGFCVLHPDEICAGRPCTIETADGETLKSQFPEDIAPHAPFTDLKAISYEVEPGLRVHVHFEGDVFETEDQRNWTDASFKTYCTPLARPYPVHVSAGESVRQAVSLTLYGSVPTVTVSPSANKADVEIHIKDRATHAMPAIGLGIPTDGRRHTPAEIERLRALRLKHLRLDLRADRPDWDAPWNAAAELANALHVGLEVALFLDTEELEPMARLARLAGMAPVVRWLVISRTGTAIPVPAPSIIRSMRDASARVGAGTNAYFAELNRERPPAANSDLVCYSINPQVHAFDDSSLVENLRIQALTVQNARRLYPGKSVAVTPVTLRPRFNPDATGPVPVPISGALPEGVDTRQLSLFGAGWTTGSLKYLAESGASSLTYYETTGWRGVMERPEGSLTPRQFPAIPGAVFPLYHPLADVGDFADGVVIPSSSSDPLRVECLAMGQGNQHALLLANLTGERQRTRVSTDSFGRVCGIRILDETTAHDAAVKPAAFRSAARWACDGPNGEVVLDLLPYATVRVDVRRGQNG